MKRWVLTGKVKIHQMLLYLGWNLLVDPKAMQMLDTIISDSPMNVHTNVRSRRLQEVEVRRRSVEADVATWSDVESSHSIRQLVYELIDTIRGADAIVLQRRTARYSARDGLLLRGSRDVGGEAMRSGVCWDAAWAHHLPLRHSFSRHIPVPGSGVLNDAARITCRVSKFE